MQQLQSMDINSILFGMYNPIPGIYGSKIKIPVPTLVENIEVAYIEKLYEAYSYFTEPPKSMLSAAAKPFVPRHTIIRKPISKITTDYISDYNKAYKYFCM